MKHKYISISLTGLFALFASGCESIPWYIEGCMGTECERDDGDEPEEKAAQSAGSVGFGLAFKLDSNQLYSDTSVQSTISTTNFSAFEFDMTGSTFNVDFQVPGQLTAYDGAGNVIDAQPMQFANFNNILLMSAPQNVDNWVNSLPSNATSVALGIDLSPSQLVAGYQKLEMEIRYQGQVMSESAHSSWVSEDVCTVETSGLRTIAACIGDI